jgi:polar amino acid transport system permease protein
MEGEYLRQIFPSIWEGFLFTTQFWAVVLVVSLTLALLVAIAYTYGKRYLNVVITGYTGLIRSTPLLFQLYVVYFGLPLILGIKIDALGAAYLTFIASWTAYLIEVLRGAIASVDQGQWDAAYVLGMNKMQTMIYVILPQALNSAIPSINNQAVALVYSTAILSVLGLDDILKAARIAVIRDFRLEGFVIAGILYAVFNGLVILGFKLLENRLNKYKRSNQ